MYFIIVIEKAVVSERGFKRDCLWRRARDSLLSSLPINSPLDCFPYGKFASKFSPNASPFHYEGLRPNPTPLLFNRKQKDKSVRNFLTLLESCKFSSILQNTLHQKLHCLICILLTQPLKFRTPFYVFH